MAQVFVRGPCCVFPLLLVLHHPFLLRQEIFIRYVSVCRVCYEF